MLAYAQCPRLHVEAEETAPHDVRLDLAGRGRAAADPGFEPHRECRHFLQHAQHECAASHGRVAHPAGQQLGAESSRFAFRERGRIEGRLAPAHAERLLTHEAHDPTRGSVRAGQLARVSVRFALGGQYHALQYVAHDLRSERIVRGFVGSGTSGAEQIFNCMRVRDASKRGGETVPRPLGASVLIQACKREAQQ